MTQKASLRDHRCVFMTRKKAAGPAEVRCIPDFLSSEECASLIRRWRRAHSETGILSPEGNRTVIDHTTKRRVDQFIRSQVLNDRLTRRTRRLLPAGRFFFELFRIACYPIGGYFRAHNDEGMNRVYS